MKCKLIAFKNVIYDVVAIEKSFVNDMYGNTFLKLTFYIYTNINSYMIRI